ncbi:MaoC family dehydratase [Thermus islandicus]|uniref:MaoC family dehydratase n=1 Tax=Thermus islandicus TaxID=540988 RepID=UPI0003F5821C|nr:MaoC/PaaZ C-terminal domain-containing protein [Thermus islandicus]
MAMYFEDFEVGQKFSTAGRTVTEADIVNFAGVSGDYNPIHTDAEHAKGTPFGQRIAHGLLVLAMLTGLRQRTGVTEGTLIAWMEIRNYRFLKPVFIGDTVRGETEIVEKRETSKPDRGILVQRVRVLNQRGEVVQEGEFVTMVRRRPHQGG